MKCQENYWKENINLQMGFPSLAMIVFHRTKVQDIHFQPLQINLRSSLTLLTKVVPNLIMTQIFHLHSTPWHIKQSQDKRPHTQLGRSDHQSQQEITQAPY